MRLFARDCPPPMTYIAVPKPDHPRFCSVCGSGLVYECDQIGFDEKTGEPRFHRWAHCPKWTGGPMKTLGGAVLRAASLNESFTDRLYGFTTWWEQFYLDCRSAHVTPEVVERRSGTDRRKEIK